MQIDCAHKMADPAKILTACPYGEWEFGYTSSDDGEPCLPHKGRRDERIVTLFICHISGLHDLLFVTIT